MDQVIAGAQAGLRVLTDGTVRLTIDLEPKDRVAAMTLFGAPGQSIALAALKDGHAAKSPAPTTTFRDLGPMCREAIDLCKNPQFHHYVARVLRPGKNVGDPGEEGCKQFILTHCNVTSRKDLDADVDTRNLFISHIRKPFHQWLDKQ